MALGERRERLDLRVTRALADVSRAEVQRWIQEGRVRVRGVPGGASDLTGPGDVIDVDPAPPPTTSAAPDASVPFRVLYEDAHLVVVDKPAGVVVHPARGHATGTLVNGLLAHGGFEACTVDPEDEAGALRPGVVHRLDKDTSGVLVVAKDAVSREGLKAQLAAHTVARRYVAITVGVPEPGLISTLHGRHPRSRLKFSSRVREGKSARTHVALVEVLAGRRAALVACRLETGRTHQIRVHLAEHAGTPILADALYGARPRDAQVAAVASALGRQALHAELLGFVHPVTGQYLELTAPPPADFAAALAALRAL